MPEPLQTFLISVAVPMCEGLVLKWFHLPKPNWWQRTLIVIGNLALLTLWFVHKWGWESLKTSWPDLRMGLLTIAILALVTWLMLRMQYTPRAYERDRTDRL